MVKCACMHACVLSRFCCVRLSATLWTIAHQAPLCTGLQARISEQVAISFSSICMTESLHCLSETITTLLIGYTLI